VGGRSVRAKLGGIGFPFIKIVMVLGGGGHKPESALGVCLYVDPIFYACVEA
jgi:hypothetical protein